MEFTELYESKVIRNLQFALLALLLVLFTGTLGYRLIGGPEYSSMDCFYMTFIPAYILILCFTIIVDYVSGLLIEKAEGERRKHLLLASLFANIGVLFLFKYINFLNGNVVALLRSAVEETEANYEGLVIGKVARVVRKDADPFQAAVVEAAVEMNKLERLYVLADTGK